MQFYLDKDYSNKLEQFIQDYYRYRYILESGQSYQSNLEELFGNYEELFDSKVLIKSDFDRELEQKSEARRLFNSLIFGFIKEYRCAKLRDYLYNEINFKNSKFENTEASLTNLSTNIKSTKNREKRLESGLRCKSEIIKFHSEFNELIEKRNELSVEFGFKNYINQFDELCNLDIEKLEELSRSFLNDTDYIYKDISKWHMKKYLDLKLEDAAYEDIIFLYNSFEFYEYFKSTNLLKNSTKSLSEMGIDISSNVNIDTESRSNKRPTPYTYPVSVPDQIYISIYKTRTIEDYTSLLGELGKSLFISSVNIDESFENKRMIDLISLEIFKDLFKRMTYENKWLERYLRIKTDKNFLQFLALKQLMGVRDLCTRLIMFRSVYESSDLTKSLEEIDDLYRHNMFVRSNQGIILLDIILNETTPYVSFSSLITVPSLEEFLRNKYDEQWWRDPVAGEYISKLWANFSELSMERLSKEINVKNINNSQLVKTFEEMF